MKTLMELLASERLYLLKTRISDLLESDPDRMERMVVDTDDLVADFSKNSVDVKTLDLLLELAKEKNVEAFRDAMFAGEKINQSEDRAVLHTALRSNSTEPLFIDDVDVRAHIASVKAKMQGFSNDYRSGKLVGYNGKPLTTIVHMGIGGSDLGPRLVFDALEPVVEGYGQTHFVANIDGAELTSVLNKCNLEETLFIVASKSFSTQETLENAKRCKAWVAKAFGTEDAWGKHSVAITARADLAIADGYEEQNIFPFGDYVGGRFSVWSAIGLVLACAYGYDAFEEFLEGASRADKHFQEMPLEHNIPVLSGLITFWNRSMMGWHSLAALPYCYPLRKLADWLQQLEMESNGKAVTREGETSSLQTSPIYFGQQGTLGQHAFYQLLHQGTEIVPCDFIGVAKPYDDPEHHRMLMANMVAQSRALMEGRSLPKVMELNPGKERKLLHQKVFPGNRPSTTYVLPELSSKTVGYLLATFEHRCFVLGALWGLNSFDQWGVELGKEMTKQILAGEDDLAHNSTLDKSSRMLSKYLL